MVEGLEQQESFTLAAVQHLGDHQAIGDVVRAEGEELETPLAFQFAQSPSQVRLDPRGGLIAILRPLCQKLHHDCAERGRDSCHAFARRDWLARDVAMHPLHRIGRGEGECAGQHLVVRHAEGVQIAP